MRLEVYGLSLRSCGVREGSSMRPWTSKPIIKLAAVPKLRVMSHLRFAKMDPPR